MPETILHHYPLSHFSEKIRRILAYKRIPWRAVEQPMMMPKPDLTPLTGGYRRIPVLQIGADVYCDTTCIAQRLERLQPEPPCLPPSECGVAGLIEDWADNRLGSQVGPPVVVEMLPTLPPEIAADRAAMSPAFGRDAWTAAAPYAWGQALLSLDLLEAQLRQRPFLLGSEFSIADAACFFPLWFARNSPTRFAAVSERPALAAWFARIEGFGPGDVQPMSTAEALAIARESEPADVSGLKQEPGEALALGDRAAITADDYGLEQSQGTVLQLTADEITIVHRTHALGEVAVHFPRAGYRIEKR